MLLYHYLLQSQGAASLVTDLTCLPQPDIQTFMSSGFTLLKLFHHEFISQIGCRVFWWVFFPVLLIITYYVAIKHIKKKIHPPPKELQKQFCGDVL